MGYFGQLRRILQVIAGRAWRSHELREHALLSLVFAGARAALYVAGLEFNFVHDWMFLSDPVSLRERLGETLLHFHAYPPGMNLLTGILLKLGESRAPALAHACFVICGLILANSLLYLFRVSGLSKGVRLGLCVAFCLTPACIYFENLYLYEAPVTALLCLAAALFYRAVWRQSTWAWLAFFLTCAVIGWVRSTFHFVWFVAMLVAAIWMSGRGARRRVLIAAAGPAALLLALYLKNLAIFGFFGAASSGGSNLAHVTVMRLPGKVRNAWIAEGKLSPYASVSVYASPRAYLPYFDSSESPRWPDVAELNALDRPSVQAPNFNHWFFLEVGKTRSADARYYFEHRPLDYARTVVKSLEQIFEPSTRWHPGDRTRHSPHHQHRQVLGRYEGWYNRLVHGFPRARTGVYVLLPLCALWALLRGRSLARQSDRPTVARGALLYFCVFQIVFVVFLSSVFTIGESSRYRYQLEALIWLIGALSVAHLFAKVRHMAGKIRGWPAIGSAREESSAK